MPYRIDYGPTGSPGSKKTSGALRPAIMSICFFALFSLLVRAFWPEGAYILRQVLFGPQADSVVQCLEEIVLSLGEGLSLHDAAVGAFRTVLYGH